MTSLQNSLLLSQNALVCFSNDIAKTSYQMILSKDNAAEGQAMNFGIARVSTEGQCLDRQIDALVEAGVDRENIFCNKVSGVSKDRPELDALMIAVREGDTVYCTELSRLARSLKQLLDIIDKLEQKGVSIVSLKEQFDTSTSAGKLAMNVLLSVSQFQRDMIKENCEAGRQAKRARGGSLGGRKKTDRKVLDKAIALYESDTSVSEVCDICGISQSTLYRELKARGIACKNGN